MLDAFATASSTRSTSCYTQFINTMKQEPVIEQLLPLSAERLQQTPTRRRSTAGTTSTSPTRRRVIDELLMRYVEALVYQAVAENMASEQSARMVAMKSATDNAGNVIDELQAGLQQDPPGGDHQGTLRDRRRRGRGLTTPHDSNIRLKERNMANAQAQGKIVQCIGAVVDIEFPRDAMPKVYDALKLEGTALTLEVQQQLGDGVVRTIALGSSDGLRRGMMVNNTGAADHGAGRQGHARPHHGRARQPDRRARPGRATS